MFCGLDSHRNYLRNETSRWNSIENGSKGTTRAIRTLQQVNGKGKNFWVFFVTPHEVWRVLTHFDEFRVLSHKNYKKYLRFRLQEELLKFQANLKRQLELIRMNTRPPPNNVPVPMPVPVTPVAPAPSAPPMPYNRQNSNSSVTANEDGWVLVPSQAESDV